MRIREREFNKNLKRKVELNDGFYKGYYTKDDKGLYKVDNRYKYKNFYQKYMNRKYRRKEIDMEETGYKSTQFRKGKFDIQCIIH